MQETVRFPYQVEEAAPDIQRGSHDRRHRLEFQIFPSAIRELHQVLVVLVPSSFQYRVIVLEIKLSQNLFQQVRRHLFIIYET